MSCARPIDPSVLADYWVGALKGAEEEVVEEHLLDCDPCGERLRSVIALAEGVRDLAREGNLQMVVSDAFLEHAAEEGLRIRQYAPPPGGSVQCTVRAEDDLLIGRLAANFAGASRVDLCFCDERGVEQRRLRDIPVHSRTKSIAFQQPIDFAKASPTNTMIARLVARDEAGDERVLGEYTFHHKRTISP